LLSSANLKCCTSTTKTTQVVRVGAYIRDRPVSIDVSMMQYLVLGGQGIAEAKLDQDKGHGVLWCGHTVD
jgi:hypothetical protein